MVTMTEMFGSRNDSDELFGLSFDSLGSVMHTPIRFDDRFVLCIETTNERCEYKNLGTKKPTVLELFKAFFYEMTFLGTEENKHHLREHLMDNQQKIYKIF
jgi:hypothetical protein